MLVLVSPLSSLLFVLLFIELFLFLFLTFHLLLLFVVLICLDVAIFNEDLLRLLQVYIMSATIVNSFALAQNEILPELDGFFLVLYVEHNTVSVILFTHPMSLKSWILSIVIHQTNHDVLVKFRRTERYQTFADIFDIIIILEKL